MTIEWTRKDEEREECRESLRRAAEGQIPLWPMRLAKFLLDLDARVTALEADAEEGKKNT